MQSLGWEFSRKPSWKAARVTSDPHVCRWQCLQRKTVSLRHTHTLTCRQQALLFPADSVLRSAIEQSRSGCTKYVCAAHGKKQLLATSVFPEGISEPSGPTINVAFRGQQPVRQDYLWRWTRLSRVSSPGSNHWTKAQNALSLSLTHTHTHKGTQKNTFPALYHTDSPYFIWQNTNFA